MFQTETGKDISVAKKFLQAGEVVAIPTETVYGLAADALSPEAVLKIFEVKNRPFFDPLIVHVHSKSEIEKYAEDVPPAALQLIERFMPGPLTLLLKKKNIIPDLVTSGLDTVGLRIPRHPLTRELLKELPFPLAAPSANPFGYISPTTPQHVADQLGGKIPYILDGGSTEVGVESTIIGFDEGVAVMYRPGGLSLEEIEKVIGKVKLPDAENKATLSPGMLKSHYAPRKKLIILDDDTLQIPETNRNETAVLAFDSFLKDYPVENQLLLSPSGDLNEAAKNLFSAMRKLDASGHVKLILTVRFPDVGLGRAINDRLKRAAS